MRIASIYETTTIIFGPSTNPVDNIYLKRELDKLSININIIYDRLIDINKVIICLVDEFSQPGINLIVDSKNKRFYLNKSKDCEKNYNQFYLKLI